jgi:hypothetical protein
MPPKKTAIFAKLIPILSIVFVISSCLIFKGKISLIYAKAAQRFLQIENDPAPGVGPGNTSIPVSDPDHFSFAVLGDTQMFNQLDSEGGFKKAVNLIEKKVVNKEVDFVMTVGDLIQKCSSQENCQDYNNWKDIAKPLLPITYEVMGNHDREAGSVSDTAWQNFFNLPTSGPLKDKESVYSFDYGNSHFIVLNSEKPEGSKIDKDQLAWLKNDLNNNKKGNVFVFYHEPAFPVSYKIGESLDHYKEHRDAFWSIIDQYNITAVFNGHEHIYSRKKIDSSVFPQAKNSVYQFVVGNTDADEGDNTQIKNPVDFYYLENDFAVVDVNEGEITVKLFSTDGGNLIDSFTFSK